MKRYFMAECGGVWGRAGKGQDWRDYRLRYDVSQSIL